MTAAKLRRSWRGVSADDLDDALQAAALDLWCYWRHLDSSNTGDPDKNFEFALRRSYHTACQYLGRRTRIIAVEGGTFPDEVDSPLALSPEELAVDQVEREQVRATLASLPQAERHWVLPIAAGETVRAQADRQGVSRMTAYRGRCGGLLLLSSMLGLAA